MLPQSMARSCSGSRAGTPRSVKSFPLSMSRECGPYICKAPESPWVVQELLPHHFPKKLVVRELLRQVLVIGEITHLAHPMNEDDFS